MAVSSSITSSAAHSSSDVYRGRVSRPGALRICHVASGDLWAGAEAQTAQLLVELQKDPALHVEAIVLNKGMLYDQLVTAGINTHLIDENALNSFEISRRLYEFNRRWRPDVVHTHRIKENCLGGLAAALSDVPVILHTVHGIQEALGGWEHVKWKCYSLMSSQVTKRVASGLIGVSNDIASFLRKRFPDTQVTCIHNGIMNHVSARTEMPETTREQIGIAEPAFVVGCVGRLSPVKGIEYLLRAVSLLVHERGVQSMHVAVVGGGPLQRSLEMLAQNLAISRHVRFLGERHDVPSLLRIFDIFAMPSLHEGVPMALLEAMRAGCPVVASAVGGIPEVIRDGYDGVLVPPQDPSALAHAIGAMQDSALDRARFSEAGRARVAAEFDARRMAIRTKKFYLDLLDRPR
ncbi:MAG: glycosyltransferase family 4 protein [Nitrospira sp. CG24E]|nr:MAG: glycosyltransferase family 4 protein [Nitrospira sp. CG24E]